MSVEALPPTPAPSMPAPAISTPSGVRTSKRPSATVERNRLAAAAAASASASPITAAKRTSDSTTPKSQASQLSASPVAACNESNNEVTQYKVMEDRITVMEEKMNRLIEEGQGMKGEIHELRDRLEEEERSKIMLEDRAKRMEEEMASLKDEIELGKVEAREKIKEVEERAKERLDTIRSGEGQQQRQQQQPQQQQQQPQQQQQRRRCIVLTDSNGRGATSDSIKNHMTREERDQHDIEVAVAYTMEEALQRFDRGAIDVRGAVVIVDNLTNDVRGTRMRPSLTPQELVRGIDRLRGTLKTAGAVAVVVCQIKPMQLGDVTPYNEALSNYLRAQRWGYGCQTQVRLSYLRPDGYHVKPQYDSLIDRTYAYAIKGVPVIDPTPLDEFVPDHLRRRWEAQWPRIGWGAQSTNQGRRG